MRQSLQVARLLTLSHWALLFLGSELPHLWQVLGYFSRMRVAVTCQASAFLGLLLIFELTPNSAPTGRRCDALPLCDAVLVARVASGARMPADAGGDGAVVGAAGGDPLFDGAEMAASQLDRVGDEHVVAVAPSPLGLRSELESAVIVRARGQHPHAVRFVER